MCFNPGDVFSRRVWTSSDTHWSIGSKSVGNHPLLLPRQLVGKVNVVIQGDENM